MPPTTAEPRPGACPLCGFTTARDRVLGYDRLRATPDSFPYVRCDGCGLVRRSPLPTPEEIPGLYPEDYGPHAEGAGKLERSKPLNRLAIRHYYGVDRRQDAPVRRFVFRVLSPWILRGLRPPRGGNRLLDVGCGGGALLGKYRDLGWTVAGVEISPRAVATARARDIEVHEGTIFDAPFEPGTYDMVLLNHVIEHVLDPAGLLRRCAEFLAPGGLLVCATPNARALGFGLYGSCWFPLEAPRHLMLFDGRTIRRLGAEVGLTARRVVTTAEVRRLCQSRHYLRTQGHELPASLAERERAVARAAGVAPKFRGYRALMSPVVAVASTMGRGEILVAEFQAGR